ncbi:hypothetical protein [Arsukibacterium sp.]|uniref:hypothetical protein n=1 Tax=Arsukibacterium sp. TaxID=1977258 RepID=UPI00299DA8B0|nr:hypothetical protein [Arsukibacterium sp.]MDX1678715.1 hypothetical protein [Arsukibacterium sp.]
MKKITDSLPGNSGAVINKALLTTVLICGVLTTKVLANPAVQEHQANMLLAMMQQSGELTRLAECVGLTEARLKNVYRQTFMECGIGDITAEESDPQHLACLQQGMVNHSGVAAERWQACDNGDDEPEDLLMAELDALTERIGEREPTAAEQRQMDQIIERMQQRGVADMEQLVDGMIAGSQGSDALVTLPVYPQAKLLINIPAQGEMVIAGQRYVTLPGASFVTTASPADVLAFYRQQLPAYREHRPSTMAATHVAYMQNVPAGFDYVKDAGRAMGIPHIFIQPASAQEQTQLPGAQTLFFVYYPTAD